MGDRDPSANSERKREPLSQPNENDECKEEKPLARKPVLAAQLQNRQNANHKVSKPIFCKGREPMVSAAGIEPATHALKGRCSTN
jgi:hypothetical protein